MFVGYGRRPLRAWRWWYLGVPMLMLAAGLAVAPAVVGFLSDVVPVYRLQRQCLAYVAPPNEVVYDESELAKRQVAQGVMPGYRQFPLCGVFHVPAAWHGFRGSYDCPDGTAFLHARQMPGGDVRLVAVDLVPVKEGELGFRASVITPGGFWSRNGLEAALATRGNVVFTLRSTKASPIRVFAGQIHRADDSRFIIRCSRGEATTNLDGRLRADGSVELVEREATQ